MLEIIMFIIIGFAISLTINLALLTIIYINWTKKELQKIK